MVDLREELEDVAFKTCLAQRRKGGYAAYAGSDVFCAAIAKATLDRITAPEDQGGLDLEIKEKRRFPLMKTGRTIAWSVAERAYEQYAAGYGTNQSLDKMAQRGGFSVGEMDLFFPAWRDMDGARYPGAED